MRHVVVGGLLFLTFAGALAVAAGVAKKPAKVTEASAPQAWIAFEEIGLFDPLPPDVAAAPLEFRQKWIKAYNEMAVRRAQQRADDSRRRHPVSETYVQEQGYTSSTWLDQQLEGFYPNVGISARSGLRYQGRSEQRTFKGDEWGGGPVVLLNPYSGGEQ